MRRRCRQETSCLDEGLNFLDPVMLDLESTQESAERSIVDVSRRQIKENDCGGQASEFRDAHPGHKEVCQSCRGAVGKTALLQWRTPFFNAGKEFRS